MYIVMPSELKAERQSWIVNWACLMGLFCLGGWLLLASLQDTLRDEKSEILHRTFESQTVALSFDLIGYGPLALNGMRTVNPVPTLARELAILGKNSRPDVQPGGVAILMGLKSTLQERVVFSGQKVYLEKQPQDTFLFSSEKTPLAMTPIVMKDGSVLIEVELDDQRGKFFLKSGEKKKSVAEDLHFAKELKTGKWWGPDLFLQNYGGEEFKSFFGKHKLEFSNSLCFVSEGDYLMWEDEQWKVSSLDSLSPFFPIARVRSISQKGVEIQAWDETGFYPMSIQISSGQAPCPKYKLEELISSIRSRTANELTCLLGKRRVVLRAGDWWLKTETSWRHLKTLNDIEDYLSHKIRGELFIFESVSMDRGKAEIKGHFFDTMRTQIQPIALTVAADKKNATLARKASRGPAKSPLIAKSEDKQTRLQLPQYQSTTFEEKKSP